MTVLYLVAAAMLGGDGIPPLGGPQKCKHSSYGWSVCVYFGKTEA